MALDTGNILPAPPGPPDGQNSGMPPLDVASSLPVSAEVLEALSDRLRPGGLFLLALRNDGSVAWHGPSAGAFFQRFVLPLLQFFKQPAPDGQTPPTDQPLLPAIAAAGAGLWRLPEGVHLAAFPQAERKQQVGVLVLAARAPAASPEPGEGALRACGRLGLHADWPSAGA